MTYSTDLRGRVLGFIAEGGSKTQAATVFKVHRSTIYEWLSQPVDRPRGRTGKQDSYKFRREDLRLVLEKQPDLMQYELAQMFGVSKNAIGHAMRRMGITRKKNTTLRPRSDG